MPVPNSCGVAVWRLSQAGAPAGVSFTHAYGIGSGVSASDAADELYGIMTGTGKPFEASAMVVGWEYESCYVYQRSSTGVETSHERFGAVAGTKTLSGGAPVSGYAPLVVSKQTALAGKKYRGRMYPPATFPYWENITPGGQIEATSILPSVRTKWAAAWTAFNTSTVVNPILLHADGTTLPTAVTGWLVRPVLGGQRRRKSRGA